MLRQVAVLALLSTAPGAVLASEPDLWRTRPASLLRLGHGTRNTPGIRIWTSGDDLVRRGERVRVYYRTERDAYVTIFRVDTDGRVRVIFPRDPGEENYGYGGATYTVSGASSGTAFYVDDYAGVGYIFGVASTAPFDFNPIFNGGRWDLHSIGEDRIHGDPLTSLEELSQRLLPTSFGDFDTHLLPYYVEQRYSYPRFVCYDCHSYVPYSYWDPYRAWCRRFTLVVWNDPYYYYPSYWYPTRYYGGTRVIYTSPGGSRYVFKTRENSAPGIDYRDRRNTPVGTASTSSGRRTVDDRGVRAADLGGVGSIPAPRVAPTGGRRIVTGGGEEPRDGRDLRPGSETAPGAVAGEGRRRVGETPSGQAPTPSAVPSDGRRRPDNPPGIEIVPGPDRPPRPTTEGREPRPSEGQGRRPTEPQPASTPAEPSARPEPMRRGEEARPPRPTSERTPESRPEPSRTPESRPERAPAPEARPAPKQPESRPERAPEARPAPKPPESRPARQPESRQPESRPAPERSRPAPERSQPAPRQPESQSRPQSAPSSPPASSPSRRRGT